MRTHTTESTGNETRRALLGLPPRRSQATQVGAAAAASTPRDQRARLFLLIDQDAPSPFVLVPAPDVAALRDALEKLVRHVLHYAPMPHAHSEAGRDAADARALLSK